MARIQSQQRVVQQHMQFPGVNDFDQLDADFDHVTAERNLTPNDRVEHDWLVQPKTTDTQFAGDIRFENQAQSVVGKILGDAVDAMRCFDLVLVCGEKRHRQIQPEPIVNTFVLFICDAETRVRVDNASDRSPDPLPFLTIFEGIVPLFAKEREHLIHPVK